MVKASAFGLCVLMAAAGQRVGAADADDRRRAHIAVLTAIDDLKQRAAVVAQTNAAPALADALQAFGADSAAPLPDQLANDALQDRVRQAEQKFRLLCPLVELACSVAPRTGDIADVCQRAFAICAVWIEPRDTGWSVQIDQDVLYPPSSDKDFTQGTQFEWTGRRTRGWFPRQLYSIVDYPAWKLFHQPKLRQPDGYEVNAFSFGFSAFTPRKGTPEECLDPRWAGNQVDESGAGCILAETDPILDDRPYAGLLYFRTRRTTLSARTSWTSDFTIGVLGTKIGHGVQQFIHRKVTDDSFTPDAWMR